MKGVDTGEGIANKTEENKNISKFFIAYEKGRLSLVWTKNINVKIIIETSEEIIQNLQNAKCIVGFRVEIAWKGRGSSWIRH